MGEEIKKSPKDIKKEKIAQKKQAIVQKKGKKKVEKKRKKDRKKFKKLVDLPEPSEAIMRAVGSGFLGVLAVVCWTYVLWGIAQDDNILHAGAMIDQLSMGNPFNALLGVWSLSFTPLTSINYIIPNWGDIFYYTLIPLLIAGILIGVITKRLKLAILGGLFFIFWGIVLPVLSVFILPIIGLFDPTLVDSVLIGILAGPLSEWNYDWLMPIFGNNLFVSWSAAGAIEVGLVVMIIALPIGGIRQIRSVGVFAIIFGLLAVGLGFLISLLAIILGPFALLLGLLSLKKDDSIALSLIGIILGVIGIILYFV
jgi:hypothetical protein